MDGREIFRRAVTMMVDSSATVVDEAGLTLDDVDTLHSASGQRAHHRRCGPPSRTPPEKVYVNIAGYGNTSAATIPIASVRGSSKKVGSRRETTSSSPLSAVGSPGEPSCSSGGARIEPLGTSDADFPPPT